MEIKLKPVGSVRNSRKIPSDDFWGSIISEIELSADIPSEAFEGISAFSHLEVIYFFDKVNESEIVYSGRPRGNAAYPFVGIFGQRKKDRPNKLGLCTVQLLEHNGRTLKVKHLDAIDGTPVIDIKPVFKEYLPEEDILQPEWVTDLMKDYWK